MHLVHRKTWAPRVGIRKEGGKGEIKKRKEVKRNDPRFWKAMR